jgi:hypothetical protein
MPRTVNVDDLTDREKDNAILILAGYSKALRDLLEDAATHNYHVKHELEEILQSYGPRLGFLERAWVRAVADPRETQRQAQRNDRRWSGFAHSAWAEDR